MRHILWLGAPFFSTALSREHWQVTAHDFQDMRVFTWEDVVRLANGVPDVVVVADKSRPPFVLGMEDFPCLTVFYAVDSHIHSWHPLYAQGFDICLVSLRDHLPLFQGAHLPDTHIWWSPPFARDNDAPGPDITPHWDCLFVGTVNPELLPRRSHFLQECATHLPGLHRTWGNYQRLFPQGRVLLNQCEHEDCNFRIFEALGCGGCLVTPAVGHGLTDMFTDNEHCVLYTPHNAADAVAKVRALLADPARRQRIAAAGLATVDAGHRAHHRAQSFMEKLERLYPHAHENIRKRQARAPTLRREYLRMPYLLWAKEIAHPSLQQAYLNAARG